MTNPEDRTFAVHRQPQAFEPDDPRLEPAPEVEAGPAVLPLETTPPAPSALPRRRGFGWGSLLVSALTGLAALALWLWVARITGELMARDDWTGWVATACLGLAVLAFLALLLKEVFGLMRLRRLTWIKRQAEAALASPDFKASAKLARKAVAELSASFASRKDLAWGRARLAEHSRDVLDGLELITLAERYLVAPLDAEAKRIVSESAQRVSVITAISPTAALDMLFVSFENLRMLRRLAELYGGKPGLIGALRLIGMVVTHIVVTGGIALTDDLLGQLVGHGLAARLSRRLGQGFVNGAMTARIGMAAIGVARPLPYREAAPPRFREFVTEALKRPEAGEAAAQKPSKAKA